ncbi:hypothetical protein [Rhizobium laguerreae]|uniref:hypothetical protein n=1 Tax=Rhizobium laguerreae TaxID=1076926 RepID=UPI001C916D6B|nr:hypothetical protein [Rhizobium laguerreae]MBY3363767.1 hypothetical protein [Rhizobium laguerreae]
MNRALLNEHVDRYEAWVDKKRPIKEQYAAKLVTPDQVKFQGLGLIVMQMIDEIRATPDMSNEQYGAMRHVIIQRLFEIWSLDREASA